MFFLLTGLSASAQKYQPEWMKTLGGGSWATAEHSLINGENRLILAGSFRGGLRGIITDPANSATRGHYLACMDSSGMVLWTRILVSRGQSGIGALSLNADNEILLVCESTDTLFEKATGELLSPPGRISLVRILNNGEPAGSVPLASGNLIIEQLRELNRDTLLLAGYFSGMATLAGKELTAGSGSDAFLAAVRNDGSLAWITEFGGKGDQIGHLLEIYNDTIFFAGEFFHELVPGDSVIRAEGSSDVFLAQVTRTGDPVKIFTAGGRGEDRSAALCTGTDGTLHLTGSFRNEARFGAAILSSAGENDIFLLSWRKNKGMPEAMSWGGSSDETPECILPGREGSVCLAGHFKSKLQPGKETLVSTDRFQDIFILSTVPGDTVLWACQAGGRSMERISGLWADSYGDLFLVADYHKSIRAGNLERSAKGNREAAVIKLFNPCNRNRLDLGNDRILCPNAVDTLKPSGSWSAYNWNNGEGSGEIFPVSKPGVYSLTVTDHYGCSYSDTVHVRADSLSAGYTVIDEVLPAGNNGSIDVTVSGNYRPFTYIWGHGALTEDPENLPAGIYAVTITDSAGCSLTLEIVVQSSSGLWISSVPNPFTNLTKIQFSVEREGLVIIDLYDTKGTRLRQLYNGYTTPGVHDLDLGSGGLKNGMYFLRMSAGGRFFSHKLVLGNQQQ